MAPVDVELFMDYHCPYSYRVVAWLDALEPERVRVRHRLFALEQVNHDPAAEQWRLWEQPLDYAQYRGRQHRRSLAAFLATAIVEATEPRETARRFRLEVYAARFEARADIADVEVLERAAIAAGAVPGRVRDGLANPRAIIAARARIAEDWAAARAEFTIFGVPTVRFDASPPFYLRLARPVGPDAGPGFLDALLAFRAAALDVLELKLPEPLSTA